MNDTDAATRAYFPGRHLETFPHTEPSINEVIASSHSIDLPMWAFRTASMINGLAQLPVGWDGYGSLPPLVATAGRATRLLAILCSYASLKALPLLEPAVSASGQQSVILEWTRGLDNLVIQVPATHERYSYCVERAGHEIEQEVESEADLLPIVWDFLAA